MRNKALRAILLYFLAVVTAGAGLLGWNADPERRFECLGNSEALCADCSASIGKALKRYLEENDETWLPQEGIIPADSLGVLIRYIGGEESNRQPSSHPCTYYERNDSLTPGASTFACHRLAPDLHAYFRKHGTLTDDLMCFRYNEGLSSDDPKDLIVLYYHKPTHWQDSRTKRGFLGRAVMTLDLSPFVEFLPEDEFQRRQRATLEYIRQPGSRPGVPGSIKQSLRVVVRCQPLEQYTFRLTAELVNNGQETFSVRFLNKGYLRAGNTGARAGDSLHDASGDPATLMLPPGGRFDFTGWLEVILENAVADGDGIRGTLCKKGPHLFDSRDNKAFVLNRKSRELNTTEIAQASIRARVRTETLPETELDLTSKNLKYMAEIPSDERR